MAGSVTDQTQGAYDASGSWWPQPAQFMQSTMVGNSGQGSHCTTTAVLEPDDASRACVSSAETQGDAPQHDDQCQQSTASSVTAAEALSKIECRTFIDTPFESYKRVRQQLHANQSWDYEPEPAQTNGDPYKFSDGFDPREIVYIRGLERNPELNGTLGIVLGRDAQAKKDGPVRWAVMVDSEKRPNILEALDETFAADPRVQLGKVTARVSIKQENLHRVCCKPWLGKITAPDCEQHQGTRPTTSANTVSRHTQCRIPDSPGKDGQARKDQSAKTVQTTSIAAPVTDCAVQTDAEDGQGTPETFHDWSDFATAILETRDLYEDLGKAAQQCASSGYEHDDPAQKRAQIILRASHQIMDDPQQTLQQRLQAVRSVWPPRDPDVRKMLLPHEPKSKNQETQIPAEPAVAAEPTANGEKVHQRKRKKQRKKARKERAQAIDVAAALCRQYYAATVEEVTPGSFQASDQPDTAPRDEFPRSDVSSKVDIEQSGVPLEHLSRPVVPLICRHFYVNAAKVLGAEGPPKNKSRTQRPRCGWPHGILSLCCGVCLLFYLLAATTVHLHPMHNGPTSSAVQSLSLRWTVSVSPAQDDHIYVQQVYQQLRGFGQTIMRCVQSPNDPRYKKVEDYVTSITTSVRNRHIHQVRRDWPPKDPCLLSLLFGACLNGCSSAVHTELPRGLVPPRRPAENMQAVHSTGAPWRRDQPDVKQEEADWSGGEQNDELSTASEGRSDWRRRVPSTETTTVSKCTERLRVVQSPCKKTHKTAMAKPVRAYTPRFHPATRAAQKPATESQSISFEASMSDADV